MELESLLLIAATGGLLLFCLGYFGGAKWIVLSCCIYLSSMASSDKEGFDNQLIGPLQWLRGESRLLCLTCLCALAVHVLLKQDTLKIRAAAPALIFLALQGFLMLVEMAVGDAGNALARLLIYAALFIVLALGLPAWLNGETDCRRLVKSLAGSGALFLAFTGVQLAEGRAAIIWQGRLLGTAGNAQHAAVLFALLVIPSLWLLQTAPGFAPKAFWALLAALFLAFLIASGSRTGLMMLLAGVIAYFRKKIALLAAVALLLWALWAFMPAGLESSLAFGHIFKNMENTRNDAWSTLLSRALESPWLGTPMKDIEYSENSYLLIAARGGVLAFLLAAWLTLTVLKKSWLDLSDEKFEGLSGLVFSFFCSYFLGAIFEGYLISNLAFPVFAFYLFLALQQRAGGPAWERPAIA